jgi:RNA polymerase-binding protein DksA
MSAARKPTRKSSASKTTSKTTSKKAAKKTSAGSTSRKAAGKKGVTPKASATKGSAGQTLTPKGTRAKTASQATKRKTPKKKSAAGRKAPARRPAKLDAKTMARIRQQLVDERRALEGEMAELEEESFQGTQSEITGEVGIDEDFADAGSATYDREQALSIANNIRDLIDQVDRAIARIDEGSYGACERCGRPIDAARLKALPRTLLCTDCKRREERAR